MSCQIVFCSPFISSPRIDVSGGSLTGLSCSHRERCVARFLALPVFVPFGDGLPISAI